MGLGEGEQLNFYDQDRGVTGAQVSNPNTALRILLFSFAGAVAFVFIMLWRSSLFSAAEYQQMPVTHGEIEIKNHNSAIQQQMAKKIFGGDAVDLDQ